MSAQASDLAIDGQGVATAPPNGLPARIAGAIVRALEAVSLRGGPTVVSWLGKIGPLGRTTGTVRLPSGELIIFPAFDGFWARFLWARVPYERDVEQIFRKLGQGRVLLDCGANIGYWSVRARGLGFAQVIAVEANPGLIPFLRENFRLNEVEGRFHNAAIYSQSGVQLFLDHAEAHAQGGIGESGIPVTSLAIGDIMKDLPSDCRIVAKLDVEGAEIAAIEGAGDLDRIVVIYEDFPKHGMKVTEFVLGRGMVVFGVSPSGEHSRIRSVREALEFNAATTRPGAPSNLVASTAANALQLERDLTASG